MRESESSSSSEEEEAEALTPQPDMFILSSMQLAS